jgi:hypothetical protein
LDYVTDENGYEVESGNHQYDEHDNDAVMKPHRFSLIQFLSSDMKTNEYKQAVQRLFHCGHDLRGYGGGVPRQFQLGCTPLNEAIMCALQQVPAFQEKHGVQIVNTVFLTDGDGHSMGACSWNSSKAIVHDPKTRKDYELSRQHAAETHAYLRILQERTGTNLIGIRLHDSKTVKNLQHRYFPDTDMSEAAKSWKTHNFCTVDNQGYDRLFIVRGNLQVATEALDNLDADASYAKIKNAFMKGSSNQKSSRVIASQIVDIIAV